MDGQFGELGVSLEDHMQRILQLGALRVVIVILRVYIKKANFQIQIQSPDSAFAHQRTSSEAKLILNTPRMTTPLQKERLLCV